MCDYIIRILENLIRDVLSDEDTRAWHRGELTPIIERIIEYLDEYNLELQVWGVKNPRPGEEPLRVYVR